MRYLDIVRSTYKREGISGILQSANAFAQAKWNQTTGQSIRSEGVLVSPHPYIDTLVLARIIKGKYESEERELMRQYVPDGSNIIDLGAGIGFTSAFAGRTVDDIGTHIAVEMNPELIPVLRQTRRLNDCGFDIINAAYTTANSSITFDQGQTLTRSSINRSKDGAETIPSVTLRDLIDEEDLSEFVLVSDIEGAEQYLLEDELNLLAEHCPLIIIELHRSVLGQDLEEWLDCIDERYTMIAERDPVFVFSRD